VIVGIIVILVMERINILQWILRDIQIEIKINMDFLQIMFMDIIIHQKYVE
jgi:hypothetical protein